MINSEGKHLNSSGRKTSCFWSKLKENGQHSRVEQNFKIDEVFFFFDRLPILYTTLLTLLRVDHI